MDEMENEQNDSIEELDHAKQISWQNELRTRVSKALGNNNSNYDVLSILWDCHIRVDLNSVRKLFDPTEELDLELMLRVIKIYSLPFKIEEVKFKYE